MKKVNKKDIPVQEPEIKTNKKQRKGASKCIDGIDWIFAAVLSSALLLYL